MSTMSALRADHFDAAAKLTGEQGVPPTLYDLLKELGRREESVRKAAADGAAGTATTEYPVMHRDDASRLRHIHFIPAAALVADNGNYATLIVRKRSAAGADLGVIAQVTTQITGSGNWTGFVPVAVPLDGTPDSNLDLAAGESLTFAITKTGTGVVVPAGALHIAFE